MLVSHQFSKYAAAYDEEASIQRHAALRLASWLDQQHPPVPDGPILEIGCGTGFLTEHILSHFPNTPYLATDLSPQMLAVCADKILPRYPHALFDVMDAETFSEKKAYALIVSGLTFQWFRHFSRSLHRLLQGLKYGGILLFSFVERESFPEWRAAAKEAGVPFTGNPLPSVDDLLEVANALSCVTTIWDETLQEVHPNALECLKSFKRIGVHTPLHSQRLSPSEMKQLLRHWDASSPDSLTLTYKVCYAAIQKW